MLQEIHTQASQSLLTIQECESTLKKLAQNYEKALQEIRDNKKLIALAKLHAEIKSQLAQGEMQIDYMQAIAKQAQRDAKTSNDNARHCEAIMDALSKKFPDLEIIARKESSDAQDNQETT